MDQILTGDSAVWTSNKAQKKTQTARKTAAPKSGTAKPRRTPRRAKAPEFIEPELATLDSEVPTGRSWLHEAKYDGYRIIARKAGDEVTLFSRSGLDWTVRFPADRQGAAELSREERADRRRGRLRAALRHHRLQVAARAYRHAAPCHPLFRVRPARRSTARIGARSRLSERRARLAKLMAAKGVSNFLVYGDYVEGSGPEFFAQACALGLEGIMSKRADSPYRSGRGKDWLKIKCLKGEEFVIGGYSRSERQGQALLLAPARHLRGRQAHLFRQGRHRLRLGRFRPARAQVQAARAQDARLSRRCRRPSARTRSGSSPSSSREIAFTERTRDGRLRHPSFKGLREDKQAREVHREQST